MDRQSQSPAWLRSLIDGAPAVAFVGVLLATHDFALATWFVVGGAAISLILGLVVERRLAPIPTFTGAMALLFGLASLAFHRADIIQMKMTIVDVILGSALLFGLAVGKNPLKALMGSAFHLSERIWRVLALRYAGFFFICAGANEYVRRTQTTQTWAEFRLGIIIATVVFAVAQTPLLLRHARDQNV